MTVRPVLVALLLANAPLVACGTVQTNGSATSDSATDSTPSTTSADDAASTTASIPGSAEPTQTSTSLSLPTVPSSTSITADAAAELAAAEDLWRRQGLSDYSFTIRRECYCLDEYLGPFEVVVSGGVAVVTVDGVAADPALLQQLPLTAEQLFAHLAQHLDDVGYRATFDPATGFPLSFWSDPLPEAADDELGLTTAAFEAR